MSLCVLKEDFRVLGDSIHTKTSPLVGVPSNTPRNTSSRRRRPGHASAAGGLGSKMDCKLTWMGVLEDVLYEL